MNWGRHSDVIYGTLARIGGLALVLVCVLFQRRGLMHWTELVFLGLCIGLQETFLRLHSLRNYRTGMLVFYSLLPLALIGLRAGDIVEYRGKFVPLILETPLPLVFVSVQIMVLYLREAPRLTSVVLVLALFSTVIGVRRQVGDPLWPWLGAICGCAATYLVLQHPGTLLTSLLTSLSGRATTQTKGARPASVLRPSFALAVPVLVVGTVLCAGLLFFALPRPSLRADDVTAGPAANGPGGTGPGGPGQSGGSRGGGGRGGPAGSEDATMSGLADGVSLGDFGRIQLDKGPALTVKPADNSMPRADTVYLRAYTFGEFDGIRWLPLAEADAPRRDLPEGSRRNLPDPPVFPGRAFTQRSYEVTVFPRATGSRGELPLPKEAQAVFDIAGPLSYGLIDNSLRAPLLKPEATYKVEVVEHTATHSEMQATMAGRRASAAAVEPRYLSRPAGIAEKIRAVFLYTQDGRTVNLFDDLMARARASNTNDNVARRGAYAAASRIVELFQRMTVGPDKAWTYSLDFRPQPGPDPIVRFLDLSGRGERFGHCEYFASAMVVLLRCFGIPARMCAGFVARKPDLNGKFSVTFANAHAWVEAWLPGHGWVTFDPTPAAQADAESIPDPAPEPAETGGPAANIPGPTEPEPDVAATADDWFENFDAASQNRMMEKMGQWLEGSLNGIEAWLARVTAWMPDWVPANPWLRAALLSLPSGTILFLSLFLKRRKRRRVDRILGETGGARRRERGLYAELLLVLSRHGFHKVPSETPMEFAQRVLRKGGQAHESVEELTRLYYGFRYGSREALVDDFKRALSSYAARLKVSATQATPG